MRGKLLPSKPTLFLICTGLGIVQRGFETYISDLVEKLSSENHSFVTKLLTGGRYKSDNVKSIQLWCIPRNNNWLNKIFGVKATAELEQVSFFFSLIIHLIFNKPSAIYLGEYKLYCYLFKFRNLFKLNYSLILYTGGQVSPGLFDSNRDFVHHVTDIYYDDLIKIGYPPSHQFILPHFVSLASKVHVQNSILKQLNIDKKKIIISIGIVDKTIKRMNLFVEVLANDPSRYFPVILGESTEDTDEIEQMLIENFGKRNYFLGKVERSEIYQYLIESDLFMLLSPKESFGLAALEALSVGLPVICCEYHESKFVLQDAAYLTNYNDKLLLGRLLNQVICDNSTSRNKDKRIDFVQKNYSWDVLKEKYMDMFNTILNN